MKAELIVAYLFIGLFFGSLIGVLLGGLREKYPPVDEDDG